MEPVIVYGDLLDQDVEVVVNAWNRNVIPWWLLLPQGVSGAIKRRGGLDPFWELRRKGIIPLGGAVETGPGRLPFRSIIHVAGINMLWRSTESSIRGSVRAAMAIAKTRDYRSIAFPLIGAGSGGGSSTKVLKLIHDELRSIEYHGEVRIVHYRKREEDVLRIATRFAEKAEGRPLPPPSISFRPASEALHPEITRDCWFVGFDLRRPEDSFVIDPCTLTIVVDDATGRPSFFGDL